MIEEVCPFFLDTLVSQFSTGVAELAPILCRNPGTSWDETKRINSPINLSSNFLVLAAGSTAV
jgi:hypothetical protein